MSVTFEQFIEGMNAEVAKEVQCSCDCERKLDLIQRLIINLSKYIGHNTCFCAFGDIHSASENPPEHYQIVTCPLGKSQIYLDYMIGGWVVVLQYNTKDFDSSRPISVLPLLLEIQLAHGGNVINDKIKELIVDCEAKTQDIYDVLKPATYLFDSPFKVFSIIESLEDTEIYIKSINAVKNYIRCFAYPQKICFDRTICYFIRCFAYRMTNDAILERCKLAMSHAEFEFMLKW